VTAPNPYEPDDDQKAANDQAIRNACAIVAASFLAETADRRLTRRLREMQDDAARLARGLTIWDAKKRQGHP